MSRRSSLQASQPTPSSTPLTTRVIRLGVALLENLDQQRYAKRARCSTVLADEPDNLDSNSPIYDSILASQGAEGIVITTNFSPSEFNLIWTEVRQYIFRQWNVGSGRKSAVSARDLLLMLFTSLKDCVSVVLNGFAINCKKFYKGSVSDKTIFHENINSHLASLAKRTGETTLEDSEPGMEQWAVLADKGYQGIQHNVRAVLPLKKPIGGILTFAEQAKNDRIASDRVIVENYFGRLKTLWATCSDTYRWSRKSYDIVFQACLALTNVHVRLHPLRAEDGDSNAQYINRLNAIGAKIIKTKRAAGKAYRSKRKVRLSMVLASENTFTRDLPGSDAELGFDNEDGNSSFIM
ncbi:hypothetical protein DYB37_013965 [Aphanomyces astaci]|uniref:DDE Tnp4 domain-containing protein n=1 Tax=Aphanomyces astaci TaxID=112090 RepID=A0A3R6XCS9_APHAT|nr:hypothetical protein DYB35_013861 [Aphanomyces astaci]RHZ06299.1 hypothetical protein DYB37_013965 [Aphanomyces astaci]